MDTYMWCFDRTTESSQPGHRRFCNISASQEICGCCMCEYSFRVKDDSAHILHLPYVTSVQLEK